MMKLLSIASLVISFLEASHGQGYFVFERPIQQQSYSSSLKDTVDFEILFPKAARFSSGAKYPVIVVFDKQNKPTYTNTINTIDYLTISSAIPNSIVIGISMDQRQRYQWTLPAHRNGKAEAFIDFLVEELIESDKINRADNFTFLIGHSRTAILASLALSIKYEKINGIFGASISYFDFGDERQKELFELFIKKMYESKRHSYYLFSVGGNANGDGHEEEVIRLNKYFTDMTLPENFEYKFYHEKTANHFTSYGLSVGNALNDAFADYRNVLKSSFGLVGAMCEQADFDWSKFQSVFDEYYVKTGAKYYPDLTFYNSIASLITSSDSIAQETKTKLLLEVLNKAILDHPKYEGFYSWIAEVYVAERNYERGIVNFKLALSSLKYNLFLTTAEQVTRRGYLSKRIEELENLNK